MNPRSTGNNCHCRKFKISYNKGTCFKVGKLQWIQVHTQTHPETETNAHKFTHMHKADLSSNGTERCIVQKLNQVGNKIS